MSTIKTLAELKEEWGPERYTKALGAMVAFRLNYQPDEQGFEKLKALSKNNPDAFACFQSYMMYEVKR